jgi:hypothetical protein
MADALTRLSGPSTPSRSEAGSTIYTPGTRQIVALKNVVLSNPDPLKGGWIQLAIGAMTTKANILLPSILVPPNTMTKVDLDVVLNDGDSVTARQIVDMSYSKMVPATAVAVINSTTDASTYATASYAGIASRAYVMFVTVVDAAAAAQPTSFTDTHDGCTWTQVGSSISNAALTMNLSTWSCQMTGTTNTTTTANFAAAMDGCHIVIATVPGADVSGTNGSEAFQDGGNFLFTTVTGTGIALPGSSICGARIAAFTSNAGGTSTAGSGFTELSDAAIATPTNMMTTEYSITPGAVADITLATTSTDKMGALVNMQDGSTPINVILIGVVVT